MFLISGSTHRFHTYFCSVFPSSATKKRETELSRDEMEFQKFMALELDAEERQRIDALRA